jgi:hypothetical protein
MKVATAYGDVDVSVLVHHYEVYKRNEEKKYEKRLEFLMTEEGKEWNRKKAKEYYLKNKEKILQKRKEGYEPRKVKQHQKSPVSDSPGAEETA